MVTVRSGVVGCPLESCEVVRRTAGSQWQRCATATQNQQSDHGRWSVEKIDSTPGRRKVAAEVVVLTSIADQKSPQGRVTMVTGYTAGQIRAHT